MWLEYLLYFCLTHWRVRVLFVRNNICISSSHQCFASRVLSSQAENYQQDSCQESPPTGKKQPLHGTMLCTPKQSVRAMVFHNLFKYTSCRRRYFPIPSGKNVIKGGKTGEATIHVNSSWCTLITKHCQGERRTKSKADAVVWKNRTTVYLWFSAWIACEVYTVVLMGLHSLGLHLLNHNSRIDIVNTFLTFCDYSKFYKEKFYIKRKSIETLESYYIFG